MEFHYIDGNLFCEKVAVNAIIEEHGTPCYVYSKQTLTRNYSRFVQAFSELNPKAAFSMKSCNNISLLNVLIKYIAAKKYLLEKTLMTKKLKNSCHNLQKMNFLKWKTFF